MDTRSGSLPQRPRSDRLHQGGTCRAHDRRALTLGGNWGGPNHQGAKSSVGSQGPAVTAPTPRMRKRTRSRPVSPDSHSPPRPWDRMELPALPAAGGCVVASVMSWVRASPLVRDPGEDGDVFDEEADESLVVQREWRSHMQRRVKVKLRGGCGGALLRRVRGEGRGGVKKVRPRSGRSGPGRPRAVLPARCLPVRPASCWDFPLGDLKACETTGCVPRAPAGCLRRHGPTRINFVQPWKRLPFDEDHRTGWGRNGRTDCTDHGCQRTSTQFTWVDWMSEEPKIRHSTNQDRRKKRT